MIASFFNQHLLNNRAGPGEGKMCRQMITGVGITLGIFLLSLNEGASLSCPFPMQRFPVGHGINCPWHAKRKNTFTCKITQNLFNLRLIFKWLNIMGYPRITVARLLFQLSFTDIPQRESFATVSRCHIQCY